MSHRPKRSSSQSKTPFEPLIEREADLIWVGTVDVVDECHVDCPIFVEQNQNYGTRVNPTSPCGHKQAKPALLGSAGFWDVAGTSAATT